MILSQLAYQTHTIIPVTQKYIDLLPLIQTTRQPNFDTDILIPLQHKQIARNATCVAAGGTADRGGCTMPPPPPAPVLVPSTQPTIAAPVYTNQSTTSLADWLYKLRMCESTSTYTENTDNGFYGAYQFSIDTWNHWNTGYARADLAPAAVQDATIIKNTLASAGLVTQNPGCYKKTGISNYPPQ